MTGGAAQVPMMACATCEMDVPAGAYCGMCGSTLSPQPGDGPSWLRLRAFGAAPAENVFRVSVVSSLFPHLPQHSRRSFRIGLTVLLVAMVGCALLRWQAPLIALSALGLTVLFQIYLVECGLYRDLPMGAWVAVTVLGAALGVGWALNTAPLISRSATEGFGGPVQWERVLRDGLYIPLGVLAGTLIPVVLVRLLRPGTRESLGGFILGAASALSFTAGATLTRLAPQLTTGMVAGEHPIAGLIVEVGIRGVSVPLIAAATGGSVGAVLWFRGRSDPAHRRRWRMVAIPVVVLVPLAYVGLGMMAFVGMGQVAQLVVYLAVAAVSLLALRLVIQMSLLHEQPDPITREPVMCPQCAHVIPDMAFCPHCGVASRAASQSSRAARRLARPVPAEPSAEDT